MSNIILYDIPSAFSCNVKRIELDFGLRGNMISMPICRNISAPHGYPFKRQSRTEGDYDDVRSAFVYCRLELIFFETRSIIHIIMSVFENYYVYTRSVSQGVGISALYHNTDRINRGKEYYIWLMHHLRRAP